MAHHIWQFKTTMSEKKKICNSLKPNLKCSGEKNGVQALASNISRIPRRHMHIGDDERERKRKRWRCVVNPCAGKETSRDEDG